MKTDRIKRIIFFCFVICTFFSESNSSFALNIDSLKTVLSKAKEDTTKVNTLLTLSNGLFDDESSTALKYAQTAEKLAEDLQYIHGMAASLDLIGALYYEKGDYPNSLNYLLKAVNIQNDPDKSDVSQIYVDLGNVYLRQADYIKSLEYYLKASAEFEKTGNKRHNAVVLMNLGLVYKKQSNLSKALEYDFKSLSMFKGINDWRNEIILSNNIVSVYLEQAEYKKALDLCFQTLQLSEKHEDKNGIQNCYSFISVTYRQLKNYPAAITYLQKALKIQKETNDEYSVAMSLAGLGKVYLETNQLNQAIDYFNKAFIIFQKNGSKNEIKDVYSDLSRIYEKQNNYKDALKYHQLFSKLNDSIYNQQNSRQINELSAKYEDVKKENEINLLNLELLTKQKDAELLNTKIQRRNSIIYGTVTGTVLLLLTIVLLFNRRQLIQRNRHQKEISRQRENSTVAVVQAQENERTRIAKDLHDSVGAYLSTLKINLQLYEEMIPKEKANGYQNALHLIDKTAVELRDIMKNLSNETLQELGLAGAFEELIARVNGLGITHFDFHSHGMSEKQNAIIELSLYRVGQELLNNCVKYAKASNATLQLLADENSVTLMLEDNGIGFDPHDLKLKSKDHGMGLKNIRDRIRFIKGTMRIESTSVNGTLVVIEVPKK